MPLTRLRFVAMTMLFALLGACTQPPAEPAQEPAPPTDPAEQAAETVNQLAQRFYDYVMAYHPEAAYSSGLLPPTHDGLTDNRPIGILDAQEEENAIFSRLDRVPEELLRGRAEWVTFVLIRQALHNAHITRVCRHELWNVNQMGGWQLDYARLAELQPVGDTKLRQQALTRWGKFPAYIDQETVNLKRGLTMGYSAPKAVVRRVIDQLDGILALAPAESPFYSPAERDGNAAFAEQFETLVAEEIHPAIRRHRDYLATEYLDQAREELPVTANPDGLKCYQASLTAYTTLDRNPQQVYELGGRTVDENRLKVEALGEQAYGLDDFDAIIAHVKADPADRFTSKEELLKFSRDAVARAEREMPKWVGRMPKQPVVVVPFPEHQEGTGRSAHYNPGNADRPGEYRIPLYQPGEQSKGNAEATAFHETWPGHHLQVAVSQELEGVHPATQLAWFSGPGEGWARYSESLAEEMGLYETVTGPIRRRAWPARGMVADPGLHVFGWSREQVKEFLGAAGRFPDERLDEMVDRIAILPGQLTAYDSGGLEIVALRREAEAALGEDFDIREFHDRVLEYGTIPLPALRAHIEAWIADKTAGG